jgi:hypothetical protein
MKTLPNDLRQNQFSLGITNYASALFDELINKNNSLSIKSKNVKFSQREFLTSIIHELKTPLNAIVGFSETLKEEILKPKSAKDCVNYAEEINAAALDLNELIHDILDVGNIGSGDFAIDLSKKIDINHFVKRALKLNYDYSLRRGISLEVYADKELSPIFLDQKRIKQILTNLISNAIKYSPRGTKIKIYTSKLVENNQEYLQISIIDQGFGMTNDQIQLAFERYKTIQNPNSEEVDSFGIGLPITKHLVELQNGEIKMTSVVGKGTNTLLKFPYSANQN